MPSTDSPGLAAILARMNGPKCGGCGCDLPERKRRGGYVPLGSKETVWQCRACNDKWLDDWPKREPEIDRLCDAQNSTAPTKARTPNGRGKRSA